MDIILIWGGGCGQSVQRESHEPRSRGGKEPIMDVEGLQKRHEDRKKTASDQRAEEFRFDSIKQDL